MPFPILLAVDMLYNALGGGVADVIHLNTLTLHQQVSDGDSKGPHGPDSADYSPSQRETPQRPIRHVCYLLASLTSPSHDAGRIGVLGGALEYLPPLR